MLPVGQPFNMFTLCSATFSYHFSTFNKVFPTFSYCSTTFSFNLVILPLASFLTLLPTFLIAIIFQL